MKTRNSQLQFPTPKIPARLATGLTDRFGGWQLEVGVRRPQTNPAGRRVCRLGRYGQAGGGPRNAPWAAQNHVTGVVAGRLEDWPSNDFGL